MNESTDTEPVLLAPAWSADWLNAWMAALGVALGTGCRLAWRLEPRPIAVFSGISPLDDEVLAAAFPSVAEFQQMCIARDSDWFEGSFTRNPTQVEFSARARRARTEGDRMLGATVSDLIPPDETVLAHSPFDAAVPQGITVWRRALSCREAITNPAADTLSSMSGTLPRERMNGLGFDARRIAVASAPNSAKYVDPVVEVMAFRALHLFPVRGDGVAPARTRGWSSSQGRRHSFSWPVWSDPLDAPAIDCLLDEFWSARGERAGRSLDRWQQSASRLSVFGAFGSVAYRPSGAADSTRGYESEVLWMTT